jgi:hypothetical protein
MDLLPEKSAVVSVAAPMKYMSGSEWFFGTLRAFEGETKAEYVMTDILWVIFVSYEWITTDKQ